MVYEDIDALKASRQSISSFHEDVAVWAYTVVCFQIVDLLPKHQHPQVFAKKLDNVKCINESWSVPGKPAWFLCKCTGLKAGHGPAALR